MQFHKEMSWKSNNNNGPWYVGTKVINNLHEKNEEKLTAGFTLFTTNQ